MKRPYLLDVNALIALAWPNHSHHPDALAWFKDAKREGWATCPLTQSAFVRISSNQRIIPEARSPQAAMEGLARLVALSGHRFLEDNVSILSATEFSRERLLGHNQVSDAHLLTLAIRQGHVLATFGLGLRELIAEERNKEWVLLIPRKGLKY